jgi:hypothetical protein
MTIKACFLIFIFNREFKIMNPLGIRVYTSRIVEKIHPEIVLPLSAAIAYSSGDILNNASSAINWLYDKAMDPAVGVQITSPRAMVVVMCLLALFCQHIGDSIEKESERRDKIRQEKITTGMEMFYLNRT